MKRSSLILQVKKHLYQLAKEYIQKDWQKQLVQFLCLIQYTRDKSTFLRKYPHVEEMILQMLKLYLVHKLGSEIQIASNGSYTQTPVRDKRRKVFQILSQKFSFIRVTALNQYSYKFRTNDDIAFLIVEKDCYFVVDFFENPQDSNNQQKLQGKQTGTTSNQINSSLKSNYVSQNLSNTNTQERSNSKNHQIFPNFEGIATTYSKTKQKKNITQNHTIQNFPTSISKQFIDLFNSSNQQCSLQELYDKKNLIKLEKQNIKSEKQISNQKSKFYNLSNTNINLKKQMKFPKKQIYFQKNIIQSKSKYKSKTRHDWIVIQKLKKSQQKRKQNWLQLEKDYYQRKRLISRKNITQNSSRKITSLQKLQGNKNDLETFRQNDKRNFNPNSTFSTRNLKTQSDLSESKRAKKPKSHQGDKTQQNQVIQTKINNILNQHITIIKQVIPLQMLNTQLKQKSKQNLIITQQNRLSVIHQQNGDKFWSSQIKYRPNSPKIISINTSNRQSIGSNVIKFNYIDKKLASKRKKSQNLSNLTNNQNLNNRNAIQV